MLVYDGGLGNLSFLIFVEYEIINKGYLICVIGLLVMFYCVY